MGNKRLPPRGNGCKCYDDCLTCPEPVCLYERSRFSRTFRKEKRYREIRAAIARGEKVAEVAEDFGCSIRTVQRAEEAGLAAL